MRPVPTRGAFLAPVQGHRTTWEFRPKGDACRTSYFRNHFELDMDLVTYLRTTIAGKGAAMNKYTAEECLKRAAECTHQAEAASDPELKLYLMKLALSWTQAAAGETVERKLEDA